MSPPRNHPPRRARAEPRDVAELNEIKAAHPELGDAVDLQIALLDLQRRVQSRVPIPWIEVDPGWLKRQQQAGRPLLRFEDIPLDWTDFRLVFRETAELLRRFGALEEEDYRKLQSLAREGNALQPLVIAWYNAGASPVRPPESSESSRPDAASSEAFEQVLLLAMRPFLARCADTALLRIDLSAWTLGRCPLCGGEPEFAVITPSAERELICSRCTGRWRYDSLACPFCQNADRSLITSFASRDGRYRIYACDVCHRYIKAYDSRNAKRPVLVAADSIATLPLDAAAMQRGYKA